jgi:sarcosine oxidase/L-pipecolate oxidase
MPMKTRYFLTQTAMTSLPKDAPIAIIGAGVFGLSTALHLGQRGYTNVIVFDKQDYDKTLYSYELGADAASAGK